MHRIEFDIEKLKHLCGIDVRSAVKNCESYEIYFIRLHRFITESKYYLCNYTGDMIVSDEEKRKSFLDDMSKVKDELTAIGITKPLEALAELDYLAGCGNKTDLDSKLKKIRLEIDEMAENVSLASITIESEAAADDDPQPTKPLILEADDDPQPAKPLILEADDDPQPAKPLILAADDKPEILTAVVSMLEDRFKVMATTSGKSAIRLIEKHPPVLFLLDIEMPNMNGYELAEVIRKKKKFEKTPIIFLTSKSTRSDVVSALKSGGNDYLVKPVDKELLMQKISQHLEVI